VEEKESVEDRAARIEAEHAMAQRAKEFSERFMAENVNRQEREEERTRCYREPASAEPPSTGFNLGALLLDYWLNPEIEAIERELAAEETDSSINRPADCRCAAGYLAAKRQPAPKKPGFFRRAWDFVDWAFSMMTH
jgi:hypothetical protein